MKEDFRISQYKVQDKKRQAQQLAFFISLNV